MNPTINIPTTTLDIPAIAVADALNQLTDRAYDDQIKAGLLKLQEAVTHRADHVMQARATHLEAAMHAGAKESMLAIQTVDPTLLISNLLIMKQAFGNFSKQAYLCLAQNGQLRDTTAHLLEPPTPTATEEGSEAGTGGTSTPQSVASSSSSSRASTRKRKREAKRGAKRQCHVCGKVKKCYPRLDAPAEDGQTFVCRRCARKRPHKPYGSKLWTPLEEEYVVTSVINNYAKHLWSKPATMTRAEVALAISKGMRRTQRAVNARMESLGLTVDQSIGIKLNAALKAHLSAEGLIVLPSSLNSPAVVVGLPCLTDDSKDIIMATTTNVQDTDDIDGADLVLLASAINKQPTHRRLRHRKTAN